MKGEALRSTLEHCRDTLDEAVKYARQSYEFGPNAYAYEALKGFTAYDAAGQLLGLFQDKHAAIEAINGREYLKT